MSGAGADPRGGLEGLSPPYRPKILSKIRVKRTFGTKISQIFCASGAIW